MSWKVFVQSHFKVYAAELIRQPAAFEKSKICTTKANTDITDVRFLDFIRDSHSFVKTAYHYWKTDNRM